MKRVYDMEEIDIKDLLLYFVKKIPIIIVVSLIVMLLGMLYSLLFKKPLYYGDVTVILVQENNNANGNNSFTQNDLQLNQKLVTTYSEIVKSKKVLNRVIEELDLDYTYGELKSNVSVSSVQDTEIIKIAVSDKDNRQAVNIANKISTVFQDEITEIYNLENISVIDKAEIQTTPYNIHTLRDTVLFFAVGLVLAVGIIFVVYYFDTSIKSVEEVEKRLEVPVIGTIPLSKSGKEKRRV